MSRLGSLQVLRALAALAIAVLHFQTDAEKTAYALKHGISLIPETILGAGVDLFFVISGFVMVYASKSLFERSGAASEFLARRLARIVPLYWVTTTLFLLVMLVSPAVLSSGGVSTLEILQSYLFIPYVAAGTGLTQPIYKLGWTLNYEMTFYLVFSLFLFLPLRRAVLGLAVVFTGLVVLGRVLAFPPGALAFWTDPVILEFVFGALIALAYLEGRHLGAAGSLAMVLTGVAALALCPFLDLDPKGPLRPLVWGLPAALILAGTLLRQHAPQAPSAPSRSARVMEKIGDASYAIYLIHPFVIRGTRILWEKFGFGESVNPWVFILIGTGVLIPLSILIYERFERPITQAAQAALQARRAAHLARTSTGMRPDAPLT